MFYRKHNYFERIKQIKENNWLSSYSKKVTSMEGEDGIIEKIFEMINQINSLDKWCVELGAGNGKKLSNTWNLIANKNWLGVLIEADKKKFCALNKTYKNNQRAICFNKTINISGKNSIEQLLSETKIPQNFELISIDIDGNDYYVWESMKQYQPKVVIIEFNPSIPNDILFIQQMHKKVHQGSSLLALTELGKKQGYELVATTQINAIFVQKQYYELFRIKDNSVNSMYDGSKFQTRLFQLYDGTLLLVGAKNLFWHRGKKIKQKKIQVLPHFLRIYPAYYPFIYKFLKRIFRAFRSFISISKKKRAYEL